MDPNKKEDLIKMSEINKIETEKQQKNEWNKNCFLEVNDKYDKPLVKLKKKEERR